MRLPSFVTSTPSGSPAGTLMFRSVPSASGTSSSSSSTRAVNSAATSKAKRLPRRKSISRAVDCWDTAMPGMPSSSASSAAATVPEYVMSSPRLEPWLIPDTTRSASKPSIRPSFARRTQSTGVPSVAYPVVPSSKSTSCTHSGRRVVIMRANAERLPSGAMTATSTSGTFTRARRSVCRPSASMPSSLVTSTRIDMEDSRGVGPFSDASCEQPAELREGLSRVLEDIAPRVAAELVAPSARVALAPAILLPRVTRVVEAVAVELHREPPLGPPAVDVVRTRGAVRLREGQRVLPQQGQEPPLERAERDARVAADHEAELRHAGCSRTTLEGRREVSGRRPEANAGLVAGPREIGEGKLSGQVCEGARDARDRDAAVGG